MDATLDETRSRADDAQEGAALVPGLVVLWSEDAPERCGEVALVEQPCILGRGPGEPGQPRARFVRQRPGQTHPCRPLDDRRLSRTQLRVRPTGEGLHLRNVGRCPLQIGGRQVDTATVTAGDVLCLRSLVLGVVARPRRLPAISGVDTAEVPWGGADVAGQVGESPCMWALREQEAFLAGRPGHILVHGPSGAGKELAARALHAWSARRSGAWVARAMATLPEALIEAELFGHVADYPSPGLAPSDGLVGAAEGGTLFLDGLGEVGASVHARLLRLMDHGEHPRLGASEPVRADVRIVAATHRALDDLSADLLARFRLRLPVPALHARREDIPLLLVHLLRRAARQDDYVRERFFDAQDRPRIDASLVAGLCVHPLASNVRELDLLLWRAIATSPGDRLTLVGPVVDALAPEPERVDPSSLSRDQIATALKEADGVLESTWRALNLKNRFQLIRLLKKHRLGRYAE